MSKRKVEKQALGKRLIIPASAEVMRLNGGYKTFHADDVYELLIGIGKDHTARLIIDVEAHKALMSGEKVDITKHIA